MHAAAGHAILKMEAACATRRARMLSKCAPAHSRASAIHGRSTSCDGCARLRCAAPFFDEAHDPLLHALLCLSRWHISQLLQSSLISCIFFKSAEDSSVKTSRKYLSAKGLLGVIRDRFNKIKPQRKMLERSNAISQTDCLMSGLAVFSLKCPSLLKFDEGRDEDITKHNLRTLYGITNTPSDTYMRERLDVQDPKEIRKPFKAVFACIQRGKALEEFAYLDKHYLLAGDGTGFFTSRSTHCQNCCVKHYNKCHIRFVTTLSNNKNNYKKHTYLFVKKPLEAWCLYYTDDKQTIQLSITSFSGLQDILLNKPKKDLSLEDKSRITEMIDSYYRTQHPEEEVTYYHNMYCAAIVHPEKKIVLPLAPEPIMKTDGADKNDCERNASKRLYADARREHPHLKFIVVEDSLASNVPHLTDLKNLNMRYIIGAKPGDHKFLFDYVQKSTCAEYSHQTEDGTTHRYRYINEVPLNKGHSDFKVNFIEYWETKKNGSKQHFTWVTDISITDENCYHIMRGGRVNWRIENNTFNTLKNQGYHFSHNFGHGYQNLCTVFGMLMMLAFLVDQAQELCCDLFKKARAKFKSRTSLWERIRSKFNEFFVDSWEDLFQAIAYGSGVMLIPNTS